MNNGERVAKACEKGRRVIHAVLGINAKSTSVNALVKVNIYRKVVIPSILFRCEHWSQINQTDIRNLNTFQHYAAKLILNVRKGTRSDIAESILGIQRIGATIDQRKLIFLAQLIHLDCKYIVKRMFLVRLFSYIIGEEDGNTTQQRGFIPDIVAILQKYDLRSYLD
ncbi:hypothetical protein KP79_PYT21570 [Mizuhopecten yessoensis]|uniref:Uncharacterized protein n=1 Tax=Mizuhopecten yessoensis TaxID=6573 RepID=A0A210R5K3_MIZYE|nr:hypothetical protein KP79_PYT21570 [Mizuhopecten yessoensis]